MYELNEPISGFDDGDVLKVTARFGSWSPKDVRLEPPDPTSTGSIELTSERLDAVAMPVEQVQIDDNGPSTGSGNSIVTEATQSEVDTALQDIANIM